MAILTMTEYALLSADAYRMTTGRPVGSYVGQAQVISIEQGADGFYAVAYKVGSEIIISYRGTDDFGTDASAFPMGVGAAVTSQGNQAIEFYKAVAALPAASGASIVTTGHSLGGGLAGFVAGLFGLDARVFDSMSHQLAATNAYNLSDIANPGYEADLHSLIYDSGTPWSPDFTNVVGTSILGEALGLFQTYSDQFLSLGNGDVAGANLGGAERHDINLLAIRLFGEETGDGTPVDDDWKDVSARVFPNLFSQEIAEASGFSDHSEMRALLAVSALNVSGGVNTLDRLPGGDVATSHLYQEMGILAEAVTQSVTGLDNLGVITDWEDGVYGDLGEAITQFSALISKNGVTGTFDRSVLDLDMSNSWLDVDFSEDTWRFEQGLVSTITGRDSMFDKVQADIGIDSFNQILDVVYGAGGLQNIDHVALALGTASYVGSSSGDIGPLRTAFFGTGFSDIITGTTGDDFILGGAAYVPIGTWDVIDGDEGNDFIIGSNGDDQLNGGAGYDYLVGGRGDDVLDGGLGFDGNSDGHMDILVGGAGDDEFLNYTDYGTIVLGGEGIEEFEFDTSNGILVSGGEGDDIFNITLSSQIGRPVVWGGAGADAFNITSTEDFNVIIVNDDNLIESEFRGLVPADFYSSIISESYFYNHSPHLIIVNPDSSDTFSLNGVSYGIATYGLNETVSSPDGSTSFYLYKEATGVSYSVAGTSGLSKLLIDDTNLGIEVEIFGLTQGQLGLGIQGEGPQRIGYDSGGNVVFTGASSIPESWETGGPMEFDFSDYTASSLYPGAGFIEIDGVYAEGTSGNDIIQADHRANTIYAKAGDDEVYAYEGDDTIIAGTGAGYDLYNGGSGVDTIVFPSTSLGVIVDLEAGSADGVEIDEDVLIEIENVVGGTGNDSIAGSSVANWLDGAEGDDSLYGLAGDDLLIGGAGADYLDGGAGTDTASYANAAAGVSVDVTYTSNNGGEAIGDDYNSIEVFQGSAHADSFWGTNGAAETIYGGAGDDTIDGLGGDDALYGEDGADTLYGDAGNDTLLGGAGDDTLYGHGDDDVLEGGAGADYLDGGTGDDAFIFHAGFGADTITDFTTGASSDDVIEFQDNVFADFAAVLAAASQVGSDTLITYDGANSVLLENVTLGNLHADDFRFVA